MLAEHGPLLVLGGAVPEVLLAFNKLRTHLDVDPQTHQSLVPVEALALYVSGQTAAALELTRSASLMFADPDELTTRERFDKAAHLLWWSQHGWAPAQPCVERAVVLLSEFPSHGVEIVDPVRRFALLSQLAGAQLWLGEVTAATSTVAELSECARWLAMPIPSALASARAALAYAVAGQTATALRDAQAAISRAEDCVAQSRPRITDIATAATLWAQRESPARPAPDAELEGLENRLRENGERAAASLVAAMRNNRPKVEAVVVGRDFIGDAGEQPLLTARQQEVLEHFAHGDAYGDAAECLGVGVNTIKTHVVGLYERLGVTTKSQALARGRDLGLIAASSRQVER